MKKASIAFIIGFVLLTACSGNIDSNLAKNTATSTAKERRLPRIPPNSLKASVLESDAADQNSEDLLKVISQGVDNPSITKEDLDRGWYFGQKHEKKYATPESWVWTDRGEKSVWMRPGVTLENPFQKEAALCQSTAGRYQYSCYDYQTPQCKYSGKSKCECPKQTGWLDSQGCIQLSDLNDFVSVSTEELKQGWYTGTQSMKKKDTPYGWKWIDRAADSRWQNSPQN